MEPDEETAPNVRMIFELARDGRKPNEIVKALFERSIPPLPSTKRPTVSTVTIFPGAAGYGLRPQWCISWTMNAIPELTS